MNFLRIQNLHRYLIVLMCVSGFLFGCSSSQSALDASSPELAERGKELQTELSLGRQIAAGIAGRFGVYAPKSTTVVMYLNTIVQTLARKAARPEINYRVEILDDEHPNAFATPGGYIFVTKGMLQLVESEQELAGVLGHEIAHVNEKHVLNQVFKKDTSTIGTMSHMMGGARGGAVSALNQAAAEGLKLLLATGYGAKLELEADQFSALLLVATGYSAKPYYNLLVRMSQLNPKTELSKTHPPFKVRLESLKRFYVEELIWELGTAPDRINAMDMRFAEQKKLL